MPYRLMNLLLRCQGKDGELYQFSFVKVGKRKDGAAEPSVVFLPGRFCAVGKDRVVAFK